MMPRVGMIKSISAPAASWHGSDARAIRIICSNASGWHRPCCIYAWRQHRASPVVALAEVVTVCAAAAVSCWPTISAQSTTTIASTACKLVLIFAHHTVLVLNMLAAWLFPSYSLPKQKWVLAQLKAVGSSRRIVSSNKLEILSGPKYCCPMVASDPISQWINYATT